MSKQIISHRSQSAYTLGKYLNLLPFELFNHVKAGRLHPIDENTGLPIPRPDVSRIKRRLEAIEQEIKVLPLAYGKLQTGIVIVRGLSSPYTIDQEKQRLDGRAEKLQKEQGSLKEKLKAITAIDDWTTYDSPENRQNDFDILQNARFHNDEVKSLNIETHLKSSEEPDNMPPKAPEPVEESAPQPENYFNRTDNNHWAIKFGNEIAHHVDHVDGLLYVAHLLNNPGKNFSDRELYKLAKGAPANDNGKGMTIEMAISNGMNLDAPPQEVNTPKTQTAYLVKYRQLQNDYDNAETDLEKTEIEEEMTKLLPYLKNRVFSDPEDKKAQINITKRLNVAYTRLCEVTPSLTEHLRKFIKTDDYSRTYSGSATWKIKI